MPEAFFIIRFKLSDFMYLSEHDKKLNVPV
ncbi:hypothetical protein BA6E_12169 [Bacteroidales bacterium 6E]|nr:hypothetical protein BA6E_12169 [Bacteroidales bacterium 6E]